jgi:hypothetical protein
MIDLNDDNDPMLFCATVHTKDGPAKLILQYMEVAAAAQSITPQGSEPTTAHIIQAIRKAARTPGIAENTPDEMLVSLWYRMSKAIETAGKI